MFYMFRQNNSGGKYKLPAIHVIIEAYSAAEADAIAERNGIYFDGCDLGYDCRCCGERWSRQYCDSDGTAAPQIQGRDIDPAEDFVKKEDGVPYCVLIRKPDDTRRESSSVVFTHNPRRILGD